MDASWFELACLALATGAVLDAWFGGSLFAPWRRRIAGRLRDGDRHLSTRLVACDFCLSYHVPYLLALGVCAASALPGPAGAIARGAVFCLAATRLAILLNAVSPNPYGPIDPSSDEYRDERT